MANSETTSHKEITWGDVGRKVFRFLCSMQFSLILLGIILAACIAGSVIPQGSVAAAYAEMFGQRGAELIMALHLDRVFTCTWFVVLAGLLCLNLTLCSIIRFPAVRKLSRSAFTAQARLKRQDSQFSLELPENVGLAELGYRNAQKIVDESGNTVEYVVRNKIGLWGSWICHFGMLLLILGFAAGQVMSTEEVVYGIPGSTQPIGQTGYQLTIDDFKVELREDYTVEQYIASLTVTDGSGEKESGTASVNHPMSAFGMTLYQDSTGWANYVDITADGDLVKQDLICAGEYTYPDELPGLVILLNKFYPDLVRTAEGNLSSNTPLCSNPHSLYSLYYNNQMMDMNLVEMNVPVVVDRYTFTFHDPVQYTLIVIKRDPTAGFVALASFVMLLGIYLAFYCRIHELWIVNGKLYGKCGKAPGLLQQELQRKLKKLKS